INELNNVNHVLVIGVGLGYHIKGIVRKYPNMQFSIFEPNLQVLHAFLNFFDLSEIKEKNLINVFHSLEDIVNVEKLLRLVIKSSTMAIFPTALRMDKEKIEQVIFYIKDQLNDKKFNLLTDVTFQMRWTQNSILNLAEVVQTPNLFLHTKAVSYLKGASVILVSAGPSLDLEIENLKKIKKDRSAYIFAVGSAVNTLIANEIMPDALFSYDPTEKNANVVQKIKELQLPIPLIFGSSIGYEVLQNYPGPKVHFFMNQDSISTNIVSSEQSNIVADAPSVAAVTLNILCQMDVRHIILVGQNLGLVNRMVYSSGIEYATQSVDTTDSSSYIETSDVLGNTMLTTNGFMQMKEAMEGIIAYYPSKVINTTFGGAHINNTEYITLSDVMETILTKTDVVANDIFSGKTGYKIDEVKERYSELENSFDVLYSTFEKLLKIHAEIVNSFEKGIISKSENLFVQFDNNFSKVEQSVFFLRVIAPITRAQYKELVARSYEVNYEKVPRKKIDKFIEVYTPYLRAMYVTLIQVQDIFGQLKNSITYKEVFK
ncbi:motility associated factor glycosyltransferase family protein, partial [Lysinibacillus mangiferihumi]